MLPKELERRNFENDANEKNFYQRKFFFYFDSGLHGRRRTGIKIVLLKLKKSFSDDQVSLFSEKNTIQE